MMMNMANSKFMNKGHVNMNVIDGSRMSEYTSLGRQPYNDRQGSTMTQVQKGTSFYETSAMKSTVRGGYASSLGPVPVKPNMTF
jgi:hypothetical protein